MNNTAKIIALAALASASTVAMPGQCSGGLVTFTSRSQFAAAAGPNLAVADFHGLGGLTFETLNSNIEPSIPAGVDFSSTVQDPEALFVAPTGFANNPAITSESLFASFFGEPLMATFAPFASAFGSDVIPFNFAGATARVNIDVTLNSGAVLRFNVTPTRGTSGFFGAVATGDDFIRSVSYLIPTNFTVGIDNFAFATAVPEPSTAIMSMVSSVIVLGIQACRSAKMRRNIAR